MIPTTRNGWYLTPLGHVCRSSNQILPRPPMLRPNAPSTSSPLEIPPYQPRSAPVPAPSSRPHATGYTTQQHPSSHRSLRPSTAPAATKSHEDLIWLPAAQSPPDYSDESQRTEQDSPGPCRRSWKRTPRAASANGRIWSLITNALPTEMCTLSTLRRARTRHRCHPPATPPQVLDRTITTGLHSSLRMLKAAGTPTRYHLNLSHVTNTF